MKIKGAIHICQVGQWKRSLTMILDNLKESGLYDATDSIDFCVVTNGEIDTTLQLPKSSYMLMGPTHLYERPTLLHLRNLAETDKEEVYYWYVHTKGLRWFGTEKESNVIDWINLLIYWNITQWKRAVASLTEGYETYGCNEHKDSVNPRHYSGNFWWSKSSHLKTLPATIGPEYNDPEFWSINTNTKWYCVFRSGLEGMGHYSSRYPPSKYQSL